MKKSIFTPLAIPLILLSMVLFSFSYVQPVAFGTKVENLAYQEGEVLKYRIHYGVINAGVVNMQVSQPIEINKRKAYNLKIEGETLKSFDWAFKVRDKFESWVDVESLTPLRYSKTVREDNYFHQDIAIYNHDEQFLKNKKGQLAITKYTQDLASAIYYLRTLDYSDKNKGTSYPIDVYMDNEIHHLQVKYVGKETINSDLGKIRCIKLKPELVVDRVFKHKDAMTVWVTDDLNHIPVRIQTDIRVGSLKVDLKHYENLKNPLTSLVKK